MIAQELLLLGLLKEGPKHGYDIKIEIRKILSLFTGIELKSVYYPLKVLEKKGLIAKRVSKPGRHPARIVYCLSPRGESRFQELLNRSLLSFKRPQFSLDLSLYFLRYMKQDTARRRLRARLLILKKLSRGLKAMVNSLNRKEPLALAYILEHNLQMVEAEAEFISRLINGEGAGGLFLKKQAA